ncbi:MAG TPA: alpha/beta hydrolase [Acidimicrobiales bacterium]|nr:alpha/beta hydrolase [Acidimicrobiales bacterium]
MIKPRLEGSVGLRDGRRMGFAEFGDVRGRTVIWLHGTPGARRQIPHEARAFALENQVRLVGIDRPGIGSSSPHVYTRISSFAEDLDAVAEALGVEEMAIIGLSGGGPYALAVGATLGDRVRAIGVLGGVAPTVGPDAIDGGLVAFGVRVSWALRWGRVPLGMTLGALLRAIRPLGSPALDLFARVSPEGDRRLLGRPELKAMFLDDLFNGSRRQFQGPIADVIAFTKDWGFLAADVRVPVVWWHGDHDHIIPFAHGVHMVTRLPRATLQIMSGESHLGGLGIAEEIFTTLLGIWDSGRSGPGSAPEGQAPAPAETA